MLTKGLTLFRLENTGQLPVLYRYGEMGRQEASCVDVDNNGQWDTNGVDRISLSQNRFVTNDAGHVWQTSWSVTFPNAGSDLAVTGGVQKTRLTGLGGSASIPSLGVSGTLTAETVSEDVHGNQSVQRTIVDRANKTVFHVNYSADSTNEEVSITVNGLSVSNLNRFGSWQAYAHDGLGRQTSTVSRAGNRTTGSLTHFNTKGQADWTEDLTSNRTSFAYDPDTGRQVAVTNAIGHVTRSEFDVDGRLLGTWGATYPVFYGYDWQGRMTNMFTLRDPAVEALVTNHASFLANIASFDRTTWLYDEATGLLTNKIYADGKGTAYTYTPDGKLLTRTWARGVTTTYRYNESGAITNIDYSDSTPDVTFGYDRQGRQTNAVAAGVAAYAFDYDPVTSAMTNEVVSLAALPAARTLARSYDSLSRPAGFSLDNGQAVFYCYDATGRLGGVAWSVGGNASTALYAYVEQSGMIAGYDMDIGGGTFRTRKSFEPSRDLITAVSNVFVTSTGTIAVSSFDYLNDALGRRVLRLDTRHATPDTLITNAFGYNLRSELTSAAMDTNSFGYAYDPIGNRKSATNNSEILTYLSNELNQYTNIADGVTNSPTYDADGNMLTCGGWTFGWDGENRLVSTSNGATVLAFAFDHMSRRVLKTTVNQALSTTNQALFLYDGWAMIEETRLGAGMAATNTFVYGPDLSGTFQGAGTIGGILAMHCSTGALSPVMFAFDANGNVADLVSADGVLAAHYEFDPYGNVTASSGDLASANPYRFSTKYTDDETGLVYYGFRSYLPRLGRWANRDPIGEEGFFSRQAHGITAADRKRPQGLFYTRRLYLFGGNDPFNVFDILGLTDDADPGRMPTPPYTNPRRATDCTYDAKNVNKEGCRAGGAAFTRTVDEPRPADADWVASNPEYCGRVCCNRKTLETGYTGPVRGPWSRTVTRLADGREGVVYGLGSPSCEPTTAPSCSSKGEDWTDAGYYHSHPDSPDFSDADWMWTLGKRNPFFVVCNGTCRMLDPWVGDVVGGRYTVVFPIGVIEYDVNSATGEPTRRRTRSRNDILEIRVSPL